MRRPTADSELVRCAQLGDRAAFEQLVVRHAERLHAVARRLVGNEHDAREVTQEAFLRAWRGITAFKGDAEFFTWLYRIAVNESNRLLASRSRRRATRGSSLEELELDPADPAPGPAGAAEHRALSAVLEAAVAQLHPDYRTPLVLRDIEGLTTEQAAAVMGLGEAAFKSRLHRARMQVRAAIADHL